MFDLFHKKFANVLEFGEVQGMAQQGCITGR
jgi:hypothetical protein